jgi:hypothetical protein
MDIRVSKVEASAVLNESSKRIGPGQSVDLDERFDKGTLRDVFPEHYFEPVAEAQESSNTDDAEAQPKVKTKKEKA